MTAAITCIASRYRRERVAFDHLRETFDANAGGSKAATLEASMLAAFEQCQATARSVGSLLATSPEDRRERTSVLLDAGILADVDSAELSTILSEFCAARLDDGYAGF